MTADMQQKQTRAPIRNEADNGVKNRRGTLSMARTNDPHSATSQFFVNLVDNAFLDPGRGGAGYAVFGCVTEGMSVVDAIAKVQDRPPRRSRRRAGRARGRRARHARRAQGRLSSTPAPRLRERPRRSLTHGTKRRGGLRAVVRGLRSRACCGSPSRSAVIVAALGRSADKRLHAGEPHRMPCWPASTGYAVPPRVARLEAISPHAALAVDRGRGPAIPGAPRLRLQADRQGARRSRARSAHAWREHDHAAGREEPVSLAGTELVPQGTRSRASRS